MTFDHCPVINLNSRADRWRAFQEGLPSDWPWAAPTRWSATPGRVLPPPPRWWQPGKAAWGCYWSHLRIIEEQIREQHEAVLIMEDDACFAPDFTEQALEFLKHVPDDWDMLYLGGQHLKQKQRMPERVNDHVLRPFNVNRLHGYAVRLKAAPVLWTHLTDWEDWRKRPRQHVDHRLGILHEQRRVRVYTPHRWLIGQGASKSDIMNRVMGERFWNGHLSKDPEMDHPVKKLYVTGFWGGGTSVFAHVLHVLGVHMGNHFLTISEKQDTFEAKGFVRLVQQSIVQPIGKHTEKPFSLRRTPEEIGKDMSSWFEGRVSEARKRGNTWVGVKHPGLASRPLGDILRSSVPDLVSIRVTRDFDKVLATARRRGWPSEPEKTIRTMEAWLDEMDFDHVVSYEKLLEDPRRVVDQLADDLGLDANERQRQAAAAVVKR